VGQRPGNEYRPAAHWVGKKPRVVAGLEGIAELFDAQKQDFGRLGEQLVTREQSLAIESDPVKSRARPLPPPEDPFC
jgi:hypothetical protein